MAPNPDRVLIFDTTLRDGEQSPGCSMTRPEKLRVARALAELGVDVIEAGFPVASRGDWESVNAIARESHGPSIAGLARCNKDDIRLGGRGGDAVESSEKAGTVAGREIGDRTDGKGDDIGAIGDGIFDPLKDPTQQTAGFALGAFISKAGAIKDGWHTLENFDIQNRRLRRNSNGQSSSGADGSCGKRRRPCAVSCLVLRRAIVAGTGISSLIDFAEVQREVGRDVGMVLVNPAVDDSNANAFTFGDVPGAVCGGTGNVVAVASNLLHGPALRRVGVEGVVWRRIARL
mgnify:CR=1 FL=1